MYWFQKETLCESVSALLSLEELQGKKELSNYTLLLHSQADMKLVSLVPLSQTTPMRFSVNIVEIVIKYLITTL